MSPRHTRVATALIAGVILAAPLSGIDAGLTVEPVSAAEPPHTSPTMPSDDSVRAPVRPAGDDGVGPPARPGVVLVRYAATATEASRKKIRATAGVSAIRSLGPKRSTELVKVTGDIGSAIGRLKAQPGVVRAEPDYVVNADLEPNDPLYPQQWWLADATGPDIEAPIAWDTTTGNPDVIVAVIDSGVDLDHPQLAPDIWTNTGEVSGNGLDDDANGRIDDLHGWDYVDADADPSDVNGHGTRVAGIIGAVGNDGIGTTGVAWTVSLMPIRVLGPGGTGFTSDVVAGIEYAMAAGARIANLSLGFTGGRSRILEDTIDEAGTAGLTIVAAAGNDSHSTDRSPQYPASVAAANVISVAAVDQAGDLAPFSNWGAETVDIAAPGVDILSTTNGGGTGTASGTSFAAPMVSGAAALLLSHEPGLTTDQLRTRLLGSAKPLTALTARTATGGSLDAGAAVAGIDDHPPVVTITAPAIGSSVLPAQDVDLTATASDPEDGNIAPSIRWSSDLDGELGSGAAISAALTPGRHLITATARDAADHQPAATLRISVGPKDESIAPERATDYPAIAIEGTATPVVGYIDGKTGLHVARRTGATWDTSHVVTAYLQRSPDLASGPDGKVRAAVQHEWSDVDAFGDPGVTIFEPASGGAWRTDWATAPCREAGDCGEDWAPSLAIDTAGLPHVAFIRTVGAAHPGVRYARRTASGLWTDESVTSEPLDTRPSLGLDASGHAHIAFARFGASPGIYHATDATGAWVITRLSTSSADTMAALAIDSADRVHVAWASSSGVRLRTFDGSWSASSVVAPGSSSGVALAVDGNDRLHVAFGKLDATETVDGIGYATNLSGSWVTSTVQTGQAGAPQIAVTASGVPHIAFRYVVHQATGIYHATNATGSWVVGAVALDVTIGDIGAYGAAFAVSPMGVAQSAFVRWGPEPGVFHAIRGVGGWTEHRLATGRNAQDVRLAIDRWGAAHVVYSLYENSGLGLTDTYYATNLSGAWVTILLLSHRGAGETAMAVDRDGAVHVALLEQQDDSTYKVEYLTNESGSFVGTYVASGIHRDMSIAIAESGAVWIASEQPASTTNAIFVHTNAGGTWSTTQVSPSVAWVFYPSIALAADGTPWVAWSQTDTGVRVATRPSSTWQTSTVSSYGGDIKPSIGVGPDGVVHVAYTRSSLDYAVCSVPLCPDYPGLRHAIRTGGSWEVERLTDYGDDFAAELSVGIDGSTQIGYRRGGIGIRRMQLTQVSTPTPPPGPRPGLDQTAPSVVAPKQGVTIGSTVGSTSIPIRVTWSGADGGSGVARYELRQRRGAGAWAVVSTNLTTASVTRSLAPGYQYRFAVRAVDNAGNVSAWAYGSTFTLARFQESSSRLRYAGTWHTTSNTVYWGGQARYSASERARMTFTFTGRSFAYVASRGSNRGVARIAVNGKDVATVKLESPTSKHRSIIYVLTWTSRATRTITVTESGIGRRIDVDGVITLD